MMRKRKHKWQRSAVSVLNGWKWKKQKKWYLFLKGLLKQMKIVSWHFTILKTPCMMKIVSGKLSNNSKQPPNWIHLTRMLILSRYCIARDSSLRTGCQVIWQNCTNWSSSSRSAKCSEVYARENQHVSILEQLAYAHINTSQPRNSFYIMYFPVKIQFFQRLFFLITSWSLVFIAD